MTSVANVTRWADRTAPEVRALGAGGSVALWPVGSTEQHGPHLVTGFDLVGATAVCERAARLAGTGVVVLPGLPFGSSDHWLALGATLSLRPETLVAVVSDVIRSVGEAGFPFLVIVNGHAGNVGPVLTALGAAAAPRPAVELVSYWTLADGAALAAACVTDDGGIGHAGEVETAIALHLGGDLVRLDRLADANGAPLGGDRPGSRGPTFLRSPRPAEESPTGVYGDPRHADPALGERVIDEAASALAAHCRELRKAPGA